MSISSEGGSEIPAITPEDLPTPEITREATQPKVRFEEHAKKYEEKIDIDTEVIKQELLRSGFSEQVANGFIVRIHDKEDLPEDWKPLASRIRAWVNREDLGYTEEADGANVHYPLAVNILLPNWEVFLNEDVWHELGHAHEILVKGVDKASIINRRNLRIAQGVGAGIVAGGALVTGHNLLKEIRHGGKSPRHYAGMYGGATLMKAGKKAFTDPWGTLHEIDGRERYARKFARQRRELTPIKLQKQ